MVLRRPWEAGGRGKERVNLSEQIGIKGYVFSTLALRGRRIEDADARPPHHSGGIPAKAVAPKVCWIFAGDCACRVLCRNACEEMFKSVSGEPCRHPRQQEIGPGNAPKGSKRQPS